MRARGDMADSVSNLVIRARDGDPAAHAALFERFGRGLMGMLTRLLGSTADADDALQDTFLLAFERLTQLRDEGAVAGWLTRIAVHQAHRRLRRRKLLGLLGLDGGERDASIGRLAAPGTPPDVHAELRLLDDVLERIPVAQRIAWMLRHVEGRELAEVARACDCSLATIKRRLAAAEAHIADHVGREGEA